MFEEGDSEFILFIHLKKLNVYQYLCMLILKLIKYQQSGKIIVPHKHQRMSYGYYVVRNRLKSFICIK